MKSVTRMFALCIIIVGLFVLAIPASADCESSTQVRGHCQQDRFDQDDNGIPDAGVFVVGKYTALYAFDANGEWYWDLGDGRIQGTVNSVGELDQDTLSVCDYNVQYRADFGNDPFMDDGWIRQHISCSGHAYIDGPVQYDFMIVSAIDPRFDINNPSPGWGENWRYDTYVISSYGNLVKPERPVSN